MRWKMTKEPIQSMAESFFLPFLLLWGMAFVSRAVKYSTLWNAFQADRNKETELNCMLSRRKVQRLFYARNKISTTHPTRVKKAKLASVKKCDYGMPTIEL